MSENLKADDLDLDSGIIFVLKVKHKTKPSGHREQTVIEQTDLFQYRKENKIEKNFCRKENDVQMKFSCFPCRKMLESFDALSCHLNGKKHQENIQNPAQEIEKYEIINGKWKRRFGQKRKFDGEDLSKRERTKKNKNERNIDILPQHTQEKFNETETYFENGYRKVRPYYFTFVAHAKGRWVGKDLWSVFSKEFRAMPVDLFNRCTETGLIKVNSKNVTPDYRIENNDFISHTVHRHELPVTESRIEVIHEDDEILVVDKPASIPVHPCGRYRHNSVIFILAKENGYKELHTVHRLDRLTSGVLIFAKSSKKSREMEALISGRQVRKEYVCRVAGEFPEGQIVVDKPILVVSYKIGVCIISEEGKQSKTVFTRLQYKDGVSTVLCKPETGRMHQIRVHLQYLGFPISNDPLYNSDIFGPEKGKGGFAGKTKEQLISDLIEKHTVENWIQTEEYQNSRINNLDIEDTDNLDDEIKEDANNDDIKTVESGRDDMRSSDTTTNPENENCFSQNENNVNLGTPDCDDIVKCDKDEVTNGTQDKEDSVEEKEPGCDENEKSKYVDEHCLDCKRNYKDPPKDTLLIYLHALKYSGEGFEYTTSVPTWAKL